MAQRYPFPGNSYFWRTAGGPEMNTLFAFCGDKVWKRAVRIHGIGAFSPWTKVGGNPL